MPASLIILMPARMRHRDYGSKEKLFSIDKNIFWGLILIAGSHGLAVA
jgi:hypothetical protein